MSSDLRKIELRLQEMALAESNPDALRIIDTLSKEVDALKNELIYERLETPDAPDDRQISEFKKKFYDSLRKERATDLATLYSRSDLKRYKPSTRLAIVQVLITIAKEQEAPVPAHWQYLLDSRGHD